LVGGIPDIADPAVDQLVPAGDAAALAEAVEQALTGPRSAAPVRPRPANWQDSARQAIRLLEPLVSARPPIPAMSSPSSWGVRQVTRRAMAAVLPRRLFLTYGPAASRALCLTFDDGPHPEYTPRLLDALKQHDIRATFFVIGQEAEQHPDLVRRMAAEGHVIGHHSYTHSRPEETTAETLLQEVRRTQELFTRLLGRPSPLFRPPLGKVTVKKLWRLWRAGLQVVLWNLDPKDFACPSADMVRAWFQERVLRGGDLVLLHDTQPHAAVVVPDLAAAAARQGLTFT